jgi:hypothetical protein
VPAHESAERPAAAEERLAEITAVGGVECCGRTDAARRPGECSFAIL